jgi:hypothetical protein
MRRREVALLAVVLWMGALPRPAMAFVARTGQAVVVAEPLPARRWGGTWWLRVPA